MIRLGDMITRSARQYGGSPALTCGSQRLTWRDVETRAWRMARALADRGVEVGDRVAYYGVNSSRFFLKCIMCHHGLAQSLCH